MKKSLLFGFGTASLMLTGCSQPEKKTLRPNIIYILADDMGYGDISRLNPGSKISTPNLDRLCSEGMYFTDAHSNSAVSTPTRYGILTGRYCFRSRLKKGVLNGYSQPLIEKDRPTLASVLKTDNYYTACIGKWHLGLGWQAVDTSRNVEINNVDYMKPLAYSPNDAGFDYSYILPASLDMPPYAYIENRQVTDSRMTTVEKANNQPRGRFWREGEISQGFTIDGCLDHFAAVAQKFITGRQKEQQPFFLYFPLTAPHTPWLPAAQFHGASGAGTYGDFVVHVDHVVGQLMDLLDRLGMADNTLIVFTSDNGADWKPGDKEQYPDHLANYIFRGEKSDAWDGGHHIPFIVRYPALIKAGSSSDALICLTDMVATCAGLTGAVIPEGGAGDSRSFLEALKGSNVSRTEVVHHSINGSFAIRQGDWKLVNCSGSGGWSAPEDTALPPVQLYNMGTDPSEQMNLYDKYPEKVEELKALLAHIIDQKH